MKREAQITIASASIRTKTVDKMDCNELISHYELIVLDVLTKIMNSVTTYS